MLAWRNYTIISDNFHTNSIQNGVYAMINFGIQNQGKKFRPSDAFDKVAFDEVTFRRSDHSTKTLDEVS